MLIAREALARRPLSPGWLSIRILSWVGLLVVAAAAALMWANFVGYELALDDDSRRRLGAAAGATTLCAVLLLVIAIVHYSFGRRGSRVGATLLTLTLAGIGGLSADGARLGRSAAARGARDRSVAAGRGGARRRPRDHPRGRRRVARLHRTARRRWSAAGVRTAARGRRLAVSRDRAADAAGARLDRGRRRQIPAADRRPRRRPLRIRRARRRHRAAARLLLLAGARPLRTAPDGRLSVERACERVRCGRFSAARACRPASSAGR